MISVDDIPGRAIDAARLAMAKARAGHGDGIPEAIAGALNGWPEASARLEQQIEASRVRVTAEYAIAQWQAWIDAVLTGTSFHGHASAEVEKKRRELRGMNEP